MPWERQGGQKDSIGDGPDDIHQEELTEGIFGSGCILHSVQRDPNLLAVTSCFIDKRAAEGAELLQLKGQRE